MMRSLASSARTASTARIATKAAKMCVACTTSTSRSLNTMTNAAGLLKSKEAVNKSRFSPNKVAVRTVFVISEQTPNPESQMFYPQNKDVLGPRTKTQSFSDKFNAKSSLLATSLFKIQGVNTVLLGAAHISITKDPDVDWDFLKPNVELVISQFFAAGIDPVDKSSIEYLEDEQETARTSYADGDLDQGIIDLLRDRVQPFVQQDGGDVEYVKTENNVVWLKMLGACAGCPKSNITLHMQIKQLIQHYFPEIVDVAEWVDQNEDHIPRPGDNR